MEMEEEGENMFESSNLPQPMNEKNEYLGAVFSLQKLPHVLSHSVLTLAP